MVSPMETGNMDGPQENVAHVPGESQAHYAGGYVTLGLAVRVLTNNGAPDNRGAGFAAGFIVGQFLILALIACMITGEVGWGIACAVALAGVIALVRRGEALELTRSALRHYDLSRTGPGALCECLEWPDRRVKSVA